MKIYFASLTDMNISIDAWVGDNVQGAHILTALAYSHPDHAVVMRGRVKLGRDYEKRFIGIAVSDEAKQFLNEVLHLGQDEREWLEKLAKSSK